VLVVVAVVVAVDTHDDSMDTVDWFRVCVENV
jgi:flavin-binding protein dodecin